MNNELFKYLWLLPLFVIIQVFVLNEILFANYINPFIYVLLIITLPKKTPNWFLLIYAFILGFSIDLFCGSIGFHSTATVLVAYLKPAIVSITLPHNIITDEDDLFMHKLGAHTFTAYSFLLILIHHTTLFLLEHMHLNVTLLFKIILSSIVSGVLIFITQFLFYKKK